MIYYNFYDNDKLSTFSRANQVHYSYIVSNISACFLDISLVAVNYEYRDEFYIYDGKIEDATYKIKEMMVISIILKSPTQLFLYFLKDMETHYTDTDNRQYPKLRL